MLIQNFLRVISASNNRDSDGQSFSLFIKLGTSCTFIHFVHQVHVKVVHLGVSENESSLVYVQSCKFHAFDMLDKNRYRNFGG